MYNLIELPKNSNKSKIDTKTNHPFPTSTANALAIGRGNITPDMLSILNPIFLNLTGIQYARKPLPIIGPSQLLLQLRNIDVLGELRVLVHTLFLDCFFVVLGVLVVLGQGGQFGSHLEGLHVFLYLLVEGCALFGVLLAGLFLSGR
jgi:hypothetical protein